LTLLKVPLHLRSVVPPDTFQVEAVRVCPGCRRQWPEGTVLCTDCGHDFRTGKKVKRTYPVRDETVVAGWFFLGCHSRFTVRRDQKGHLFLIKQSFFLWIPVWTTVIDLRDYDAVVTDYKYIKHGDIQYDEFYLELHGRDRS